MPCSRSPAQAAVAIRYERETRTCFRKERQSKRVIHYELMGAWYGELWFVCLLACLFACLRKGLCIAQTGLKFSILYLHPTKCWGYRQLSLCLVQEKKKKLFWDKVSCCPGWPQIHRVAKDDLELWIERFYLLTTGIIGIYDKVQFVWIERRTHGFIYARQSTL